MMDESMFSILGESLIAESSDAITDSHCSHSSQPFTPNIEGNEDIWQRSVSQQTDSPDRDNAFENLSTLNYNCRCACHLFRNGHVSDETPCSVCCLENSNFTSSVSEMVSRPSPRNSRHCSNAGSGGSHKITTPPNSVVSENLSDEVIVLSTSGTPPYPPPHLNNWHARGPDWIWDWSSRPEAYPPKGWPGLDAALDVSSGPGRLYQLHLPGLVCSHLLALLLGIYIGRRIKNS